MFRPPRPPFAALLRKKEKKNASFFTPTSVIIGVVAIVVAVCGYMAYTHAIADTSRFP